jgi:hypothetical protein
MRRSTAPRPRRRLALKPRPTNALPRSVAALF